MRVIEKGTPDEVDVPVLVPKGGLEPPREKNSHQVLNLARLPIPPLRLRCSAILGSFLRKVNVH